MAATFWNTETCNLFAPLLNDRAKGEIATMPGEIIMCRYLQSIKTAGRVSMMKPGFPYYHPLIILLLLKFLSVLLTHIQVCMGVLMDTDYLGTGANTGLGFMHFCLPSWPNLQKSVNAWHFPEFNKDGQMQRRLVSCCTFKKRGKYSKWFFSLLHDELSLPKLPLLYF